MLIHNIRTSVYSTPCDLVLMDFDQSDAVKLKELFIKWQELKRGLKEYKLREPNLPEGISEVAFCLITGSSRFVSATGCPNSSFDSFNIQTNRTEQIKACSVQKDLTSFGPRSKWDDLYFLDFYNGGDIDGHFDIYLIPTELIHSHQVNRTHTFLQQQMEGKRPRLSIKKDIIIPHHIAPLYEHVQI